MELKDIFRILIVKFKSNESLQHYVASHLLWCCGVVNRAVYPQETDGVTGDHFN
eukprot:CAMPEP_0185786684 /NCGR_PEP_ID=MMETSP1174-20130828/136519_1 /TAXON_ID=35687 /ORGANISM="Dictyocha speculum, Strain CCMP1381" /LENGTH=53 /DNA_ID=CAMNT_0028479435 /DNA_START=40 /DNA_END=201 /DNA_ORIENTATION=-